MNDITLENVYLKKRGLLRDRLKSSSKVSDSDIACLTNLDLRIAEMQSKRKYPLWTKFKNFGEFSINKADKKHSLGFYAKMAWNFGMRVAKTVAVAAVYPPVTVPLVAAYMVKKSFEPDFYTFKNRVNYHPQSKGSWLRTMAMSSVFNQPSFSAALSNADLSAMSFVPDGKDAVLQRINRSKQPSEVVQNVEETSKPNKKQKTEKKDKSATLSPEAAKKIMDSIFIR